MYTQNGLHVETERTTQIRSTDMHLPGGTESGNECALRVNGAFFVEQCHGFLSRRCIGEIRLAFPPHEHVAHGPDCSIRPRTSNRTLVGP